LSDEQQKELKKENDGENDGHKKQNNESTLRDSADE